MMTFLHSRYNFRINLSPKDLLEISEEISRTFAPRFSTPMPGTVSQIKLSPREIVDISEIISREFAPRALTDTPELMLLPIDPDHLYAYWNLGEINADEAAHDGAAQQLTLRIYSEPDNNGWVFTPMPAEAEAEIQNSRASSWFDIDIQSLHAQQTILLPVHVDETAYSAVIGKRNPDNSLDASTYSNTIHVPRSDMAAYPCNDDKATFDIMPLSTLSSASEIIYYLRKNASGQGKIH